MASVYCAAAAAIFVAVVSAAAATALNSQPPPLPISDGLDQGLAGAGNCRPAAASTDAVYFVVLDAGSTGTRAIAHRFRRNQSSPLGWDHLGFTRHRRKPDLSAFRHFPVQCRPQLESLLAEVVATVPERQRAETCLLLRATAGFRLMDARSRYLVAREVRDVLRRSELRAPALDSVRILEGSEEAKYTWLSVNYVLGSFHHSGGSESTGTKPVLEMGGGSLQIAYESSDGDQTLTALSAQSQLHRQRKLRLRARSYLGLGIRESILRFVGHDRDQQDGEGGDVGGEEESVRASYRTACLAENLTLDFTFGAVSVLLNGTGANRSRNEAATAAASCLTRARDLIARLAVQPEPALNQPANRPLYAISGLYHLLQFAHKRFGASGGVQFSRTVCPGRERCLAYVTRVGVVADAAADVCRDLPTDGPYKPYYCINLAVTAALLQSEAGMALRPDTPLVALGGQEALSWTLGLSLDYLRALDAASAAAAAAASHCVGFSVVIATALTTACLLG